MSIPDIAKAHHSDAFRDFNTTMKLALRMARTRLPALEQQLTFMLMGYKMMKTVNKRWPYRYFSESIAGPYGARMRARDEPFFMEPGLFTVPGYEKICDELRAGWRELSDEDKSLVWDACDVLLSKGVACSMVRGRCE